MLNVDLGNNELIMTLKERTTLSTPIYLLKFINTQNTTDIKYLFLNDTSGSEDYYNRVSVEVVNVEANEDLANGVIYLLPGMYRYEAYESTSTSIDDSTGCILEHGIVRYNESTVTEYNDNTTDTEYVLE